MKGDQEMLMQGCRSDENSDAIELMLTNGVSSSHPDIHGVTPLHVAAAFGQVINVHLLLERSGDINASDKLGWTPIMQAARSGHSTVVCQLLARGASTELKTQYGANLLFLATASNDLPTIDAVTSAISKSNLLKQAQSSPIYPLAIAIISDNMSTIKALMNIHPDLNFSSSLGLTPLMITCAAENPILTNFLLDNNAKIDPSNYCNQTALDIAKLCQNNHIIRLIKGKQVEDEKRQRCLTPMRSSNACLNGQGSSRSYMKDYRSQANCVPIPVPATKLKMSCFPPPPTYSEHIHLSAMKSPHPCCSSPQTPCPVYNHAQFSESPYFSANKKANWQNSRPLPAEKLNYPLQWHNCRWLSPNFPDKPTASKFPQNAGLDPSRHASNIDTHQNSEGISRRADSSAEKPLLLVSPKEKRWRKSPKQLGTQYRKLAESNKSHWSGLQQTISKLKSPKPKHIYSPQKRLPTELISEQPTSSARSLEVLLHEMDLAPYTSLFMKQELDVETFLALTEEDLSEIGINFKDCTAIMTKVNKMKGSQNNYFHLTKHF